MTINKTIEKEEFYIIGAVVCDKFGQYSFDYMKEKDGEWTQTIDIRFAKRYYLQNSAKEALEDILNNAISTDNKEYYIISVLEEYTFKSVFK